MNAIGMSSFPAAATAPEPKPKNLKDAAEQFEAMLLQQMLRSTRESMESESGDSGGSAMREFAEQNLSQLLARNGGLGVGSMIARGLAEHQTIPTGNPSGNESATMRQNGNQIQSPNRT